MRVEALLLVGLVLLSLAGVPRQAEPLAGARGGAESQGSPELVRPLFEVGWLANGLAVGYNESLYIVLLNPSNSSLEVYWGNGTHAASLDVGYLGPAMGVPVYSYTSEYPCIILYAHEGVSLMKLSPHRIVDELWISDYLAVPLSPFTSAERSGFYSLEERYECCSGLEEGVYIELYEYLLSGNLHFDKVSVLDDRNLSNIDLPVGENVYAGDYNIGPEGSIAAFAFTNATLGGSELGVIVWNLTSGEWRVYKLGLPSGSAALLASSERLASGLSTARISFPWYAGYTGNGILYTAYLANGSFRSLNVTALYGIHDIVYVDITTHQGGPAVLLVGLSGSPTNASVEAILVDPSNGSLLASATLGASSWPPRAVLGRLAGSEALYIVGGGRLYALNPHTLDLLDYRDINITIPASLHYAEARVAGSPVAAILAVAGLDRDGRPATIVYRASTEQPGLLVSLDAPSTAYTGRPFTLRARVTWSTGSPVVNATVVIEEYNGSSWTPIATAVTGDDGVASASIVFSERGQHSLRARCLDSYSGVARIGVYTVVNTSIEAPEAAGIAGVPIPLVIRVTDGYTGSPAAGVWVNLEVNTSSGWAVAASAVSDSRGEAIVNLGLPEGNYTLRAVPIGAYVVPGSAGTISLRVYPPLPPPPEGPYVSPVGRILAFAPPIVEVGSPARVVFAFYYGEYPLDPEDYLVRTYPEVDANVSRLSAGVYVVSFTPTSTGLYTVVFEAEWNHARYIGSASLYAHNVTGPLGALEGVVESINESLPALIETLFANINSSLTYYVVRLNSSAINYLGHINETLVYYLASLNRTVSDLNLTVLASLIEDLNESVSAIVVVSSEYADLLRDLNASVARLESLVREGRNDIVAVINASNTLILARLGDLGYNLSLASREILEVETRLGLINVSLRKALGELGLIKGILVSVNETTSGLRALIQDSTGSIRSILLDDLKPRILDVEEGVALLNTSIGVLIANLSCIQGLEESWERAGGGGQAPPSSSADQEGPSSTTQGTPQPSGSSSTETCPESRESGWLREPAMLMTIVSLAILAASLALLAAAIRVARAR